MGKVITKLSGQYRAADFPDFLDEIDRDTGSGLSGDGICGNFAAHNAPGVQKWLLAHPRFHLHFTPRVLAVDQPGRTVFRHLRVGSRSGMTRARPFKWTKTADQTLDRICRYCSCTSEPAH